MLVLLADGWTNGWSTMNLFCVYRSSWRDPLGYIRLFGHVLGHANWEHFLNNMLLLLVVGPPMEEKYGSIPLLKGILFTALVTGVLQCKFQSGRGDDSHVYQQTDQTYRYQSEPYRKRCSGRR